MIGGRTIDLAVARPDLLDDAGFRRARASLPDWRRERADRYQRKADRYASVVAFSLLQYLWRERVGGPMPDVVRGEHGKPRFAGPAGASSADGASGGASGGGADPQRAVRPVSWHFNWSHDASVCVCAFGTTPLGVDVQSRVRYSEALFTRIAAPGELHLAQRLREEDDLSLLWTRKEAAVKRTGSGLTVRLDQQDTVTSDDILTLAVTDLPCYLSLAAEGYTESDLRTALKPRFLTPAPAPEIWTDARSLPSRAADALTARR